VETVLIVDAYSNHQGGIKERKGWQSRSCKNYGGFRERKAASEGQCPARTVTIAGPALMLDVEQNLDTTY
jgi:hypothetical protein